MCGPQDGQSRRGLNRGVDMHKLQRIITLLKILENGKPRSIAKLAEDLRRTERTIWRDIAELKALNYPVKVEQGSCRFTRQAGKSPKTTWRG